MFPLLRLPYLCVQCVLQQIDVLDLIDFSLSSNRCHQIVKSLPPVIHALEVYSGETNAEIVYVNKDQTCGKWLFDYREKISNETKTEGCKYIYAVSGEDPQETVAKGIEYLTSLFNCPITNVILTHNNIPKGISRCEKLQITGKTPMSNHSLKNLLEQVTIENWLILHVPTKLDFQFDPTRFRPSVINCVENAPWLSPSLLLTLNCKRAVMSDCHWSASDCAWFITQWFHSENTKFECLRLRWSADPGQFSLGHLECVPFCKSRRSEYIITSPTTSLKCTNGTDILRNDGLLATVLMENNHLLFHVWHERFVGISEAQICRQLTG